MFSWGEWKLQYTEMRWLVSISTANKQWERFVQAQNKYTRKCLIVFKTMEASGSSTSLFAGADVEADCLTFVEEIPQKEVEQIEVIKWVLFYIESNKTKV